MIDFKKSLFLFKKSANAQQAAYFVKAEKPLYERTPLPDQHPRSPRAVSRAGLEGATKVFKHGRKSPWVPTLTGPIPNGQENAGS